MLCLMFVRLAGWLALLARSAASKDAEPGWGIRTVSPSIPTGISALSASTITSSAARTVTPPAHTALFTVTAATPSVPASSPGPAAKPDPGYGTGFTGHGTMVMQCLGLAGNSHLAFPNGGLGASDKPSDNGATRRQTQRDAPRHS
jgi:hypothetical protein